MCPPEPRPRLSRLGEITALPYGAGIREILLPLPWFLLSLALYSSPIWPLGALASFMVFLCALRLNHEAIHGNLGLSRTGDSLVMHGLSVLMLGSNHAEAWCHLRHHSKAGTPDDIEGRYGRMSALQVLAMGPMFPVEVNLHALRTAPARMRRRIAVDWVLVGIAVLLVLSYGPPALMLHVAAMLVAQCLAAFFAVWITHQGTEAAGIAARSQRGVVAKAAYLMLYHREHHLFPNVPVSRLPELAARLDSEVEGYAASRLPVLSFLDRGHRLGETRPHAQRA